MKPVKFLKAHRMYQPGEVAGFDAETAVALITSGVAVDPNGVPSDASPDQEPMLSVRVFTTRTVSSLDGGRKKRTPKGKPPPPSGEPTSSTPKKDS